LLTRHLHVSEATGDAEAARPLLPERVEAAVVGTPVGVAIRSDLLLSAKTFDAGDARERESAAAVARPLAGLRLTVARVGRAQAGFHVEAETLRFGIVLPAEDEGVFEINAVELRHVLPSVQG